MKENTIGFNFELVKDVKTKRRNLTKTGVSVNVKYGTMLIPRQYIEDKKLHNQFFKLYVDVANRALGWKLMKDEKQYLSFQNAKECKRFKPNKTGSYIISVRSALNQFKFKDNNIKFSNLEIEQYSDISFKFYKGIIYYVKLKEPIKINEKINK